MTTPTIPAETFARYALLTADEHYAMQGRAYREAVRCWREARNADPSIRPMLTAAAKSADAFYQEVTLALSARTRPEMTAPHRILSMDGTAECFACGIVVEVVSDGETRRTFDYVPCKPGGWDHPPYLIPYADDSAPPLVETCAAHPYANCKVYPLPA